MVHLGKLTRELLRVTLRQAARHDELLAGAACLVGTHLENRLYGLLLGRSDEPAGVDDDDRRCRRVLDDPVARLIADPEHDLGVDAILRASQRDEMNGPRPRHRP